MGAYAFDTIAYGTSATDAFNRATDDARYEYGHGGYTGTIAEKHDFAKVTLPEGIEYNSRDFWAFVDEVRQERFSDKWGPAGAILLEKGEDGIQKWFFFGWASS